MLIYVYYHGNLFFSFGRVIYELLVRDIPFFDWVGGNMSVEIIQGAEPNYGVIPTIRQTLIDSIDEDLRLFDILNEYMVRCCRRSVEDRPSMPESKFSRQLCVQLHFPF